VQYAARILLGLGLAAKKKYFYEKKPKKQQRKGLSFSRILVNCDFYEIVIVWKYHGH